MQPDDPLALIRFGVHAELGMVVYCSDADHPQWRVGVNELDTLPMVIERALDHIAAHHEAREISAMGDAPVMRRADLDAAERAIEEGRRARGSTSIDSVSRETSAPETWYVVGREGAHVCDVERPHQHVWQDRRCVAPREWSCDA